MVTAEGPVTCDVIIASDGQCVHDVPRRFVRERLPEPQPAAAPAGAAVAAVGSAAWTELGRAGEVRAWAADVRAWAGEAGSAAPPPPPPPHAPPLPIHPPPPPPPPPSLQPACRHSGTLAGSFHHTGGLANYEHACHGQPAEELTGRAAGAAATWANRSAKTRRRDKQLLRSATARDGDCGGGSAGGSGSAGTNGGCGGVGGRGDTLWAAAANHGSASRRRAPRIGQAYQAAPPPTSTAPYPNPSPHPNPSPTHPQPHPQPVP